MKKILLATNNPAKLEELKLGTLVLKKYRIMIVCLDDLNIKEEPDEIGKTFRANAFLKAKFYGDRAGLPTIADDGGLTIPILNNEPGVKSRRWLGWPGTDEELMNYTLIRLKKYSGKKRTAYLTVCLCFYDPATKKTFYVEEKIRGEIAEKPTGRPTNGYPFRSLFIVSEFNKFYDELTKKEHQQINHRLIALKQLTAAVKKYMLE